MVYPVALYLGFYVYKMPWDLNSFPKPTQPIFQLQIKVKIKPLFSQVVGMTKVMWKYLPGWLSKCFCSLSFVSFLYCFPYCNHTFLIGKHLTHFQKVDELSDDFLILLCPFMPQHSVCPPKGRTIPGSRVPSSEGPHLGRLTRSVETSACGRGRWLLTTDFWVSGSETLRFPQHIKWSEAVIKWDLFRGCEVGTISAKQ